MRFYDVPGGAEQLPVVSCGGRARLYYIGTRSLSGLRSHWSVGGCESLGEKFFRWRWARRRRCCGGTGSSRDACDLHLALPCPARHPLFGGRALAGLLHLQLRSSAGWVAQAAVG